MDSTAKESWLVGKEGGHPLFDHTGDSLFSLLGGREAKLGISLRLDMFSPSDAEYIKEGKGYAIWQEFSQETNLRK